MSAKLKELNEQLHKTLSTARDIAKAAEEDGDRDLTAEERTQVKVALDEATKIKGQITEAKGDAEMLKSLDDFGDDVQAVLDDQKQNGVITAKDLAGMFNRPTRGKTAGEMFTESDEFKAFMAQFPNGRIPEGAKGLMSPPVEFGGMKTLVTGTSDTSGGAFVQTDYTGIFDAGTFQRPLTFRDIITNGTTSSDTVEYVRVTSFTNNADAIAEATGAGTVGDGTGGTITAAAGGVKPESALALEKVTAVVKTIAHWIPVTKRALSDAAQVRTLIDNFLRYGLEEELEDQIVNGAGSGEDFVGIAEVSGVQAQAWDTDLLVTTRKARTKVKTVGRAVPNAFLLNPADWERIDLLQDNENRYYFGGPMQLGTPRLWGLPVIESEAVTSGVGYVGDFRTCVLWDREQASVQVSDSHSDFFIRNLVAILAEMRAAFGVVRPKALVEMDLTA